MDVSGRDRNGAATGDGRGARALFLLALLAALALLTAPSAFAARQTLAASAGTIEDVPYGPSSAEDMDIYPASQPSQPAAASSSASGGAPVVVLVHGGGWRLQGPNTLTRFRSESRSLQAAGFSVFTIDYRQDSRETAAFPMEPQDVLSAVNWVLAHAASYGGDPNRLVLVGGSAGGQLVAAVAEQLAASRPGVVKGVVSLSGPFNLPQIRADFREETITSDNFRLSFHQALHWWFGKFPQAFAEEWSPALHVPTANCPGWLLFNSEKELIPVEQAQEMQANLTAAGCSSKLVVVPGEGHAFEYWSQVDQQIFAFVDEH
jgi:arylformamidase